MGYSIYSISSSLASRLCLLCSLPSLPSLCLLSLFLLLHFFFLLPIRFVPDPSPPSRPPSIGISCLLCARYVWVNPLAVYRHRCSSTHAGMGGGDRKHTGNECTAACSQHQRLCVACVLYVRACVQKHTQAGEWEEK